MDDHSFTNDAEYRMLDKLRKQLAHKRLDYYFNRICLAAFLLGGALAIFLKWKLGA